MSRATGANNGLMVSNNLEDLAEAIGGFIGMADGIERPQYMDTILTRAFKTADRKFNTAAAVAADGSGRGRNFRHMYEYGTTGINPGEGNLDPKRKASRLWHTVQTGSAGRKLITFAFVPARRPNPKKRTGDPDVGKIKQEVLDKLAVNDGTKKYVWPNRAAATEQGHTIWMEPKDANFLFVPVVQDLHNPEPYEEARGYGIRKRHASRPGDWTDGYGAFGGFFMTWWTGPGGESIGTSIINYVNRDVKTFAKTIGIKRGGVKPAQTVMVNKRAEEAFRKAVKQWQIKAATVDGGEGYSAEEGKVL